MGTDTPLVSVVLATFNGQRFLAAQLDSLLAQTYPHIEIIAVDDASTDGTLAILQDYAQRCPQLTVLAGTCNLGYQKNFERGFKLANGEFIAPCDQDDIWLPEKIQVLVEHIGDHPIAYCNSAFIGGDGQPLGKTMADVKTLADFDDPLMYVIGASAPGHAMLVRTAVALAAMPFPTLLSHDNWLGFVATFYGTVKFVDRVLVYYRRHDGNVFGAVKKNKAKAPAAARLAQARQRVRLLAEKCPAHLPQQQVLQQISDSYQSYSLAHNWARLRLFFRHKDKLLKYKKHNALRRHLYCLKVFVKII